MTLSTRALVARLAARLCSADEARLLVESLRAIDAGGDAAIPLVSRVRAPSATPDADLRRKLQLARLREELRHGALQHAADTVVSALSASGIDPIVCGGFAIAESAYPVPALRHCHDIDMLVPAGDVTAADEALRSTGFVRLPGETATWRDARGIAVLLHGFPFRDPSLQRGPFTIAQAGTVTHRARVGRMLAPEWLLACRLEHSWRGIANQPLPVLMDAAVLARSTGFDWNAAIDLAAAVGSIVPLAVVVRVLGRAAPGIVPMAAAERVAQVGARAGTAAVRAAARGASRTRADFVAVLAARPSTWPALAGAIAARRPGIRAARASAIARWRPSRTQTWLLQAALEPGAPGLAAWQAWCRCAPTGPGEHRALEELGPLVHDRHAAGRSDPVLQAIAPSARWAWIQRQQALRLADDTTAVLRGAGVDVLWLKGVALAALYPSSPARPMGDIDLCVRPADRPRAVEALHAAGWRWAQPVGRAEFRYRHARLLARGTGELLDLHWHVLSSCCRPADDDAFWSGAIDAGRPGARTLCAADQVVHAIAHAFFHQPRSNVRWVTDAMTVLGGAHEVDWTRVVDQARDRRLVLACREGLAFLSTQFRAPVPRETLARLAELPVTPLERAERVHWRGGDATWVRAARHWCLYCRAVSPGSWWRAVAGFPAYVFACTTHAHSEDEPGGGRA